MPETRNPCWKQLHEITCDKVSISKDKIVTMKSDETLESITKKLQENGFWSAPVINEKKECIGTIDLQDLVGFLAACVVPGVDEETAGRNLSLRTAQEILTMSPRDAFVPLDPRDNCTLLVTLFSTGIHRCPLIDKEGVVVGLVAQFDVAVELNKELHQGAAKGMGETELSKFGVGMSVPITIEQDQLVTHAVTELDCYQVSALPVVDGNGRLVGNFSVTDLINIWTDKDGAAKLLEMTVTEYLERNSKESLNPITCKQSDSLNTAVSLMIEKKIHRVWIVDENQKPIGVVSMTDLFKIVRDHIDASVGGNATHDIKDDYGSVFKTFQGQAIGVAASGDKVELLNDSNDKQAVWRVTHLDRTHITLQGANDKYLAVDAKHNVLLLDAVADDAKFELIRSDTGAVALHDAHNGFIEVHGKNVKSHASKTNKPTRRQWLKLCAIFGK